MPEEAVARITAASEKRQAVTIEPPQSVLTIIGVLMIVAGLVGAFGLLEIGTLVSGMFAALAAVICWWSMRARPSSGERREAVLRPRALPGWINPLILAIPLLQIPIVAVTGSQGRTIDRAIVIGSIVIAAATAYIYGRYADRALFGADRSAESVVDDSTRGFGALVLSFLGFVGPGVYVIERSLALGPRHGLWFEMILLYAFLVLFGLTLFKRRQAISQLTLDSPPGDVIA